MPKYAVGGPIPADAPLPKLENGCILPASVAQQLADSYGAAVQLRANFSIPSLADLVETGIVEAIEETSAELSKHLGIPDFAEQARIAFQPYFRPYAEAVAASMVAGETPEQFKARLDALTIEEP